MPALPLPARVSIHYPPSAAAEAAAQRRPARRRRRRVEIVPVRIDISRSNVRFYHDADGAAAAPSPP